MKKKMLSALLTLCMVISLLPAVTLPASADKVDADSLSALGFDIGTEGLQDVIDSGVEPFNQKFTYSLFTVPELLFTVKNTHTLGDSLRIGDPKFNTTPNLNSTLNIEKNISHHRTIAFDGNGDGRDNEILELYAEVFNDGGLKGATRLYFRMGEVEGDKIKYGYGYQYATLRFTVFEHQADAYLQAAAGDFDGDGKDEFALYVPCEDNTNNGKYNPSIQIHDYTSYNRDAPTIAKYDLSEVYNGSYTDTPTTSTSGGQTTTTHTYEYDSFTFGVPESKSVDTWNRKLVPVVDMAVIEQPVDDKDDLAVTISAATHLKGDSADVLGKGETNSVLYIFTDPVHNYGPFTVANSSEYKSSPWGSAIQCIPLRWTGQDYAAQLSGGNSSFKKPALPQRMLFAGVDAGDLNGDGYAELAVAGYCNDDKGTTYLPSQKMYLASYLNYDAKSGYYDFAMPGQWLSIKRDDYGDKNVTNIDSVSRDDGDKDVAIGPLQVVCFAERGSGLGESALIGGLVTALKSTTEYGTAQQGTYPDDKDKTCQQSANAMAENGWVVRYALPLHQKDGNGETGFDRQAFRMLTDAVAGNLANDPNGREQLVYAYAVNNTGNAKYACFRGYLAYTATGDQEVGNAAKGFGLTNCKHEWDNRIASDFSSAASLALPDVDNDSTLLRRDQTKPAEFYFSDPKVLAVLQAAPYFGELVSSEYTEDTGSTSFSKSTGGGTGTEHEVSLTGGVTVGFGGGFKLGVIAAEVQTRISASFSAGYAHATENSTTYTTGFTAVADDSVVLVLTPQIRYHYEIWDPKSGAWVETIMDTGQTPQLTQVTVDFYDEWANAHGKNPIRKKLLANAVAGDPASYRRTAPDGWNGGEIVGAGGTGADDFIRVGTAGGSISMSVESEEVVSNGITWGAGAEWENEISGGLGAAGSITTAFGVEYSGGYTKSTMKGVSFEGEVADIPASMAGDYAFQWKFGSWKGTLDGNDCVVLGYLVKNASALPKAPQNLHVSELGANSITLGWDSVDNRVPEYYEVYRYIETTRAYYKLGAVPCSQDRRSYTYPDADLEPDQDYTYAVRAFGYATGSGAGVLRSSYYSTLVTGHTNPTASGGPVITQQPEDGYMLSGSSAGKLFSVAVQPVSGGGVVSYQWQSYSLGSGWYDLSGEKTESLSFANVSDNQNGTRYRCLVTQKVGGDFDGGPDAKLRPAEFWAHHRDAGEPERDKDI